MSASTSDEALNKNDDHYLSALDKARAALAERRDVWDQIMSQLESMPEPSCSLCGRIIYCCVGGLCKEQKCGLK